MKKTLVIGASPNKERYSYKATVKLKSYGHEVYPYGLRQGMIEDVAIITELPQTKDFHTVTLYVAPDKQAGFYQFILELKPERVIFNPGTENPELEQLLEKNNIQAVEACTLVLLNINNY